MAVVLSRGGWVLAITATISCSCSKGGAEMAAYPPAKITRIVLVTVDTLRFDALHGAGSVETDMPRTLALARRGLVFERCYASSPTTQPTHASLFTGLHPWEHGVVRNGLVLDQGFSTLAERFQSQGWETRAVVASYPVQARFGFAQGFDAYDDDFTFERQRMPEVWVGQETEGDHFYSISDSVSDKAIAALDAMLGERQFLWVHYFDPHSPYGDLADSPLTVNRLRSVARSDPDQLEEKLLRARELYRSDVRRLDGELSRFLARVSEDAEEIETHVILTADHGEGFGEHGAIGHDVALTAETIHVPCILLSPRVEPGVCGDPAGTIDLHATLLALAGLPGSSDGDRGRDLTRSQGRSGDSRAVGMRAHDPELAAPRFFMVRGEHLITGDRDLLLEDDLAARELSAEAMPELRRLFGTFAEDLAGVGARQLGDEETLRALNALGYGGGE